MLFPATARDAGFAARPQLSLRSRFCAAPCRGGRPCPPDVSGIHRTSSFVVTPQPSLRGPTFSAFPEKVGKKRRWMRIGLYRSATESPRRRTLRPTHDRLSAKLHYSAACVVTTLPSIAVSTQGDGKTRCRGNGRPSTYAPVVPNICRADVGIGPYNMLCNIVIGRVFRK